MQAWDLANEFCERYLGDTYDYVFTIHTDRDHLHAHILFNSVSRVDGYKYHYKKGEWEKQIHYVKRINHVAHYLDAKNPFAVKWRGVRKDAIDVGRIFEECMYLLENDVRDSAHLDARYGIAGRKEKNIIHRIRTRDPVLSGRQPAVVEPAKQKSKSKPELVKGRSI